MNQFDILCIFMHAAFDECEQNKYIRCADVVHADFIQVDTGELNVIAKIEVVSLGDRKITHFSYDVTGADLDAVLAKLHHQFMSDVASLHNVECA
jgi:hypothetical protein